MTTERTDNLELPLLDDVGADSFYASWVEAMNKINAGDKARIADLISHRKRSEPRVRR